MKPLEHITYELLHENNTHWLVPLFKASYHKTMRVDDWKRKYGFSGMDKPMLGLFVKCENIPVGFVGILSSQIKYRGKQEWMAELVDVMIHPDYRGRNLFTELLGRSETLCKEMGYTAMYCFPNQNSFHAIVNKLNWETPTRIVGYRIPLGSKWKSLLAKGMRKFGLAIQPNSKTNNQIPFNEQVFFDDDRHPTIVHDVVFFNYKNSKNHHLLKLTHGYAWVKAGSYLSVGHIHSFNDNRFKEDLEELVRLVKKWGYHEAIIQLDVNNWRNAHLTNLFPSFESWKVAFKNFKSTFPMDRFQVQFCDTDSFIS